MRTRSITSVLLLSLYGTYGCSLILKPSPRSSQTPQPSQQNEAANIAATQTAVLPMMEGPLLELVKKQDEQDENLFAPISERAIELALRAPQIKAAKAEVQEKPPKPQEIFPTVLQKVPGPSADDRLLELLEEDLKRAVEQSPERRPFEFSNSVVENDRVRYYVNYYCKREKEQFAKALSRSGRYVPIIARALREEGIPEELAYLALIESEFYPQASSPMGAVGIWQFVANTARRYGLRIDSWVDERRDPIKSTRAAAAYLKDLHGYFGHWYLTTAAYNAGQGTIDRAMQNSQIKDFTTLTEKAKIREETRNFVPKFVAASLIAASPEKYGFGEIVYETPLDYDEVEIQGSLQLDSLAEMAGSSADTIRELNPALLRGRTPPGEKSFFVRVPAGHRELFVEAYAQHRSSHEADSSTRVVTHEVKSGETLLSIARHYGQKVRALMELNGLKDSRLRVGQKLQITLDRLRTTFR